jgi:hypothetical protein
MKRILFLSVIACVCLAGGAAFASGHYVNGVEGIKAASLPPEGVYYRMYNVFYTADQLKTAAGRKAPGNFKANVYAMANRFIYSTPIEILGGNLVIDAIVPLVYTDMSYKIGGNRIMGDNRFGVGDICVEPFVLAWHGERWDTAAGVGLYMPTGSFSQNRPASPGKGLWTVMGTLGGTVYLDAEKSWSASILGRYEIHTEQEHTHITPGNNFHFEWGVGKTFNEIFTIGAAGYCGWQTTKDSGKNAATGYERLIGVGPEIGIAIPAWKAQISLRSLWEVKNKNAPQGLTTVLVLTKAF